MFWSWKSTFDLLYLKIFTIRSFCVVNKSLCTSLLETHHKAYLVAVWRPFFPTQDWNEIPSKIITNDQNFQFPPVKMLIHRYCMLNTFKIIVELSRKPTINPHIFREL